MAEGSNQTQELSGWKQIASYLGVSVRTAQKLEKEQGLPVHRGDCLKGPVFAWTSELGQWRASLGIRPKTKDLVILEPPSAHPNRRTWLKFASLAGAVAVGVVGYGLPRIRVLANQPPSAYRLEGATLIILGRDGTEIWRYTFPVQLDELEYRGKVERCLFQDLDGDGHVEVLFQVIPKRPEGERSLVCISFDGRLRWKFVPGHRVVDNFGRDFAPPFWPAAFEVVKGSGFRPAKVILSSNHNWSFPTQIAVLDGSTGRLLSEYWHRGHVLHLAVADLDGDGEPEVLVGGVNDAPEYKQAVLLVFDHRRIAGATRNPLGGLYYQGMSPGTEKCLVLFPKTPFSQRLEFNMVTVVRVDGGRIRLNVTESTESESNVAVIYELDLQLRPVVVALSDSLMERYQDEQRRGTLPAEPVEMISERLKGEVKVIKF